MCCVVRVLSCHGLLTSQGDTVEGERFAFRQRPQETRRHCFVVAAHHHQSGGHHCGGREGDGVKCRVERGRGYQLGEGDWMQRSVSCGEEGEDSSWRRVGVREC